MFNSKLLVSTREYIIKYHDISMYPNMVIKHEFQQTIISHSFNIISPSFYMDQTSIFHISPIFPSSLHCHCLSANTVRFCCSRRLQTFEDEHCEVCSGDARGLISSMVEIYVCKYMYIYIYVYTYIHILCVHIDSEYP